MKMNQLVRDPFVQRMSDRFQIQIDNDWSLRESKLYILNKILKGQLYDNLSPFTYEYSSGGSSGTYIPLAQRRPSVTYRLPKIIVEDSTSMLFGEQHFPTVRSDDKNTDEFLQYITRTSGLTSAMLTAAKVGSVGSVCIIIKVLSGKFHFEVLETTHLYPVFDPLEPDCLLKVVQKQKLDGNSLIMLGYDISENDKNKLFYLKREWNGQSEIYYLPYLVSQDSEKDRIDMPDNDRSTNHDLGFVPAVWIKNLPSNHPIDGECTFESLIDANIEIDYQLSQLGRLLKYHSDPTLVIKNPSQLEGNQIIKGIGTLSLDSEGDAYFVEMTTGPTQSVIDYVKCLREYALETVRANRANPDKLSSVHSGQALKMLNSPLISLVDEMRLTYGEFGLVAIYKMILDIYHSDLFFIECGDTEPSTHYHDLFLDWPDWYSATPQDNLQEAQALSLLLQSHIISEETATTNVADEYNINDIPKEISAIAKDINKAYNNNALSNNNAKSMSVDRSSSNSVDR